MREPKVLAWVEHQKFDRGLEEEVRVETKPWCCWQEIPGAEVSIPGVGADEAIILNLAYGPSGVLLNRNPRAN